MSIVNAATRLTLSNDSREHPGAMTLVGETGILARALS